MTANNNNKHAFQRSQTRKPIISNLGTIFHDLFNNINHILVAQGKAIGNMLMLLFMLKKDRHLKGKF